MMDRLWVLSFKYGNTFRAFLHFPVSENEFLKNLNSSSPASAVRRQSMKVRINATGDTIVMKFLHPDADTKLEGYILGYGSSMFSKQFIQLPENGQLYETEFGKRCPLPPWD